MLDQPINVAGDDEALPPFAEGPPLPQIPPGKGCTEQYQKGCRFCYYDFTKHLAVCDECMNNYGMTTEGFCSKTKPSMTALYLLST